MLRNIRVRKGSRRQMEDNVKDITIPSGNSVSDNPRHRFWGPQLQSIVKMSVAVDVTEKVESEL